jgi:SAM-dependent methyltransferase
LQRREHWDRIYATKTDLDVSWFERTPTLSLRMIHAAGVTPDTCLVDIGGGNSRLVDALLGAGLHCLAVLDVSAIAIENARARLGAGGHTVKWIAADVTGDWSLPLVDIWHDRAVFHFLTDAGERERYVKAVIRSVRPGGIVIVATFAEDGPTRCSGLPVMRYSADQLHAQFGAPFVLAGHERESHHTPTGNEQKFVYCFCRKVAR